jgi:hypothetical protein
MQLALMMIVCIADGTTRKESGRGIEAERDAQPAVDGSRGRGAVWTT